MNTYKKIRSDSDRSAIDYEHLIQSDRIHGSLYTRQDIFDDEMEKVFYGNWVFVGHASEIPQKGDYVCRPLARESIVMVRNDSNEINVLINRCAHRGNMICVEEEGSAKFLTCLYHGWTYSLDGNLVDVPGPGGFTKDKADLPLQNLRTESYRGFVFASFNPDVLTLDEYLGRAKLLIDRSVEMSPTGEINLSAGWVKHKFGGNWKMLPENDTDGYHVQYVHSSIPKTIDSEYVDVVSDPDEDISALTRGWQGGHAELDLSPTYTKPLEWLGAPASRFPDYVKDMAAAYGEQGGEQKMIDGPPHATIFPNLFLGEMNIVIIQPINANECVQWHTPMLLEGVPDNLNNKFIRQSEAAMGPSSLLLADDGIISERQQIALQGESHWLDLSRGIERQEVDDHGDLVGRLSDEVTNRTFWHHYRDVMSGA
jgi:phenylpropionate dioxygenase-like ring-hydroxylating dioxygenase large terminal subunit